MPNFLIDIAKARCSQTRKEMLQIVGMAAHDLLPSIIWMVQKNFTEAASCHSGDPVANVKMDCLNRDTLRQ